jgi:hypothetical protein
MLKRTLTIRLVCVLLLGATCAYAQKAKTIMGDAWNGVVESADESTREIKLVNPDKKTETFVGILEDGYQVKLKDGTSRELKVSELKPGLRVRLFYKSKTQDVAGRRTKVNSINRVQFLGRDEYTRMRETLKVEPSTPVVDATSRNLPSTDPFKLHLAFEPENLDKGLLKWVEEWNKYESKKHGRVEIVDDMAQADVSLIVIWGKDDSFFHLPALMGRGNSELRWVGFGTGYLTIKDDNGLHLLWEGSMGLDMKDPERTAPGLGRLLEKKLKARKK